MDCLKGEAFRREFELARDKVSEFVTLITDLVEILVGLLLQAVEETFLFEFCQAFLKQVSRILLLLFTETKFGLDLD